MPEGLCAHGPEGRFVHELVIPLERDVETDPLPPLRRAAPDSAERSFAPGSRWLYAKLYAGAAAIDDVLRQIVAEIVDDALRSAAARSWFFIRYADPERHLRVRFKGDPDRLWGEVLPRLHAATSQAMASGLVWRMQLDTYEREVERYGGVVGVALAEELFRADSDAALAVLQSLVGTAMASCAGASCCAASISSSTIWG